MRTSRNTLTVVCRGVPRDETEPVILFERNVPLEPAARPGMAKGRNATGLSFRVANLLGPYSSVEISWHPERDCEDDSDEGMTQAKRDLMKLVLPELTNDLRQLAEILGGELPKELRNVKSKKKKDSDE